MIEVEVDRKVHSLHLIEVNEAGLHDVSVVCHCNPDNFCNGDGEDNVFAHQRVSANNKNKPADYDRYLLFEDGGVVLIQKKKC